MKNQISDRRLDLDSEKWLVERGFRTHKEKLVIAHEEERNRLTAAAVKRGPGPAPAPAIPPVSDVDLTKQRRWQEHAELMAMLAAEEAAFQRVADAAERASASIRALKEEQQSIRKQPARQIA